MKKRVLPKVEPVHIKPLFGLKPGLWLTILYALVLFLLVFLIGFLPGIKKGGKRVTFESAAYNAAVYVDGTYIGGTPFTRFVASGDHEVDFKVNGVELDSFEISVGHPVFMTWMFPRKMKVTSEKTLNKEAFEAVTREFLSDVSTYSAILSYDDTFRYKPIFSDYIKSVENSSYSDEAQKIMALCTSFITTKEMLEDYNSCASVKCQGLVTSVKARDLSTFESLEVIGSEALNNINGIDFGTFTLSQICITENQFAEFVKENPKWAVSNKENLISQGLVNEYYLSGVNLSTSVSTNRPVVNVSYYAAEAYCKWLSEKTGKKVSIPTETQWIECALSVPNLGLQKSIVPAVITGMPSGMIGGVWEITSSAYIPDGSTESSDIYSSLTKYNSDFECIVKGGSYISSASVSSSDIGSAPKDLCSDYMGFRIIWQ